MWRRWAMNSGDSFEVAPCVQVEMWSYEGHPQVVEGGLVIRTAAGALCSHVTISRSMSGIALA